MKTYVIDLDQTLCITEQKEDGTWDYFNSIPIQDRIDYVNKLWEDGNTIIIETARGSSSKINWYNETYDQLRSWGLKFNSLRVGVKFAADYFIDDKAINSEDFFNGKF